ncbi:hypothetical protein Nther_1818 [Natranaerobius thermophilus JW/NM-WN-LF]|uniref:YqzL family protein n=1 Tax=Natranaerobius thermophilus (strain ATCC BAA-1301 / DSM 18059 / JW/NM-WN-LF) TaxID=457570 RepID=B2A5N6_NATTJ|nr:hypothetical protein Nther_1818 [Natranaerobius thermophilus JW/NM-WN-LF]
MIDANFFWRMFELTGSITAYLAYRDLVGRVESRDRKFV